LNEEAPKWKEELNQGIKDAVDKGRQLKDLIDSYIEP